MNRLFKKCVITAAGLHVLLALILLFCPGFFTPKFKQSNAPEINFIPTILIPGDSAGGGNPNANPPPAAPPAPPTPVVPPTPAPAPAPHPEPVKVVTPPKPVIDTVEPVKEPVRSKPVVDVLHTVTRSVPKTPANETSTADNEARRQNETRRLMANAFGKAANNVKTGTGTATRVDDDFGPGGGGPSYAGYGSWVRSVYARAWVQPQDTSSDDATVEVTVTIASDGTVIAKRISLRSGDQAVDASVQRVLDRVTTVERPFPEGSKEKQHSFIIPFHMKTKRGTA